MFVSVFCDISADNHQEVSLILSQYGFSEVMKNLFESSSVDEDELARLKLDIDRSTDSYDNIRIYQYPMDDTLVISAMEKKKWRKIKVVL
ncbi:MAG: CRISPR-associated protein Cas2 [Spirochaetales bacterium]|nr:CRISPR-associated protein Cas2 [Spirochaetales bacterium]